MSSLLEVPFGVPQGSQLSPLLFIIFIMELPDAFKEDETNNINSEELYNDDKDKVNKEGEDEASEETVVIYADDNTPNCTAISIEELKEKTQGMAERAVKCFTHNQRTASAKKTII